MAGLFEQVKNMLSKEVEQVASGMDDIDVYSDKQAERAECLGLWHADEDSIVQESRLTASRLEMLQKDLQRYGKEGLAHERSNYLDEFGLSEEQISKRDESIIKARYQENIAHLQDYRSFAERKLAQVREELSELGLDTKQTEKYSHVEALRNRRSTEMQITF